MRTDHESITASQKVPAMNVFVPLLDCLDCRVELSRYQVRSELDRDRTCLDDVIFNHRLKNRWRLIQTRNWSTTKSHGLGKNASICYQQHMPHVSKKKTSVLPTSMKRISIQLSFSRGTGRRHTWTWQRRVFQTSPMLDVCHLLSDICKKRRNKAILDILVVHRGGHLWKDM